MSQMGTPTRRDFLTHAAGAMFVSSLPKSAERPDDPTVRPLCVDLSGPMAFALGTDIVDVWLPKLTQEHEAGIETSLTSMLLGSGDYELTGPKPASSPQIHLTNHCTFYNKKSDPKKFDKTKKHVHLTMPMPRYIVALSPIPAWIYQTTNPPPPCKTTPSCALYAVGFRFIYEEAGVPTLKPKPAGSTSGIIPLDVAPFEIQVNMSIGYVPLNRKDDHDVNAQEAFKELSKFIGSDLTVETHLSTCHCTARSPEGSAYRPCKAPVINVT